MGEFTIGDVGGDACILGDVSRDDECEFVDGLAKG